MNWFVKILILNALLWAAYWLLFCCESARGDELWKITASCSCKLCCGKTDGITASGKPAKSGYVACNWLPFGTRLVIDGNEYVVMDRGAKSLFGSKRNHIKHLDIWFPTHKDAVLYGVQYKPVTILKG